MSRCPQNPLRPLLEEERQQLMHLSRCQAAPASPVARAKAVLMAHGMMPLYTPVSGSWLNMAESIQRILVSRALSGQQPDNPEQLIAWLEAVAHGWNAAPTPFEGGGKRAVRRQQARERRHRLGGSGAVIHQPLPHQGVDSNGDVQND